MYRLPELIQFRAASGTADALSNIAEAEGKRVSAVVREAVDDFLQRSRCGQRSEAA